MAQGTWTSTRWVDPDSAIAYPAIVTPIEFGPDGQGVYMCMSEGPGGLGFVIESDELTAMPDGDVTMNYRMDTDEEVIAFSSWTRGEAGTTVRFAGTGDELAALNEVMLGAISPAFFWVVGPLPTTDAEAEAAQAENRLLVAVLESQGLADALAGLPCGAG